MIVYLYQKAGCEMFSSGMCVLQYVWLKNQNFSPSGTLTGTGKREYIPGRASSTGSLRIVGSILKF